MEIDSEIGEWGTMAQFSKMELDSEQLTQNILKVNMCENDYNVSVHFSTTELDFMSVMQEHINQERIS